jgi:hypothetical protein
MDRTEKMNRLEKMEWLEELGAKQRAAYARGDKQLYAEIDELMNLISLDLIDTEREPGDNGWYS